MIIRSVRSAFLISLIAIFVLPLAAQWRPVGPDGGDVRSIAYDPKNPDRVFLGTSAGQLYLSENGGVSWLRLAHLGGGTDYVLDNIEVDPSDPNTMFVAAWSVDGQIKGGDVFRSHDGGKTWQPLPAMHGKSIRALAIAASNHKIIVAGALDGVFRSKDGGDSWHLISPPNHAEIKNIESVAIDPRDPSVIYAGTWHLAWKTNDGGADWHSIKNGVIDDSDVFSIIVDKMNSSVVYLSACSGIYKSEQAGELFHKIQGMPFSARRTRVLQQDPNNVSVVYAGTTEGLWKTVDAGKTWKRMTGPNIIVNDVMVDPRNSGHVLIATDRSGVLVSNDGGQAFTASNRGFSHRQVSEVVVDKNDPNTLFAGVVNDKEFGGVFVSHDGGMDWHQISNGLGERDVFTLAEAGNALIAGTNRGIFRFDASDRVWRPINTVLAEKQVRYTTRTKGKRVKTGYRTEHVKSELNARVAQIKVASSKWFAATSSGLYTSSDNGKEWRGGPVNGQRNFVSVSSGGQTVLAATPKGVLLSQDQGNKWIAVVLPHYVTAVYGVSVAGKTLWVASREGALRSEDGGSTWEHVLSGLPGRNVIAVEYDKDGGRLLASASSGALFESRDQGESWQRIDGGWTVRRAAFGHGRLLAITAFDGLLMFNENRQTQVGVGGGN